MSHTEGDRVRFRYRPSDLHDIAEVYAVVVEVMPQGLLRLKCDNGEPWVVHENSIVAEGP